MSVENFLKEAVDADAINHYLQLLAQRQIKYERTIIDLNEQLNVNAQTLLTADEKNNQLEQIYCNLVQVNKKALIDFERVKTDLGQLEKIYGDLVQVNKETLIDLERANTELGKIRQELEKNEAKSEYDEQVSEWKATKRYCEIISILVKLQGLKTNADIAIWSASMQGNKSISIREVESWFENVNMAELTELSEKIDLEMGS